jgi:Profilin
MLKRHKQAEFALRGRNTLSHGLTTVAYTGRNRFVVHSYLLCHHWHANIPFSLQADGCILVMTKQAVLVAEYIAPNQAGEVAVLVENLGDYLIGLGY